MNNFERLLDDPCSKVYNIRCDKADYADMMRLLDSLGYKWEHGERLLDSEIWADFPHAVYCVNRLSKSVHITSCFNLGTVLYYKELAKNEESTINQAWECAKKLYLGTRAGGLLKGDLAEIFGCTDPHEIEKNFSINEICRRIAKFEDEYRSFAIGDIVEYADGEDFLVIRILDQYKKISVLSSRGECTSFDLNECRKTGKHIDMENIYNQLRKEEEV